MKLNNMSKEEIEQLSYTEITEKILEEGTPLNTLEIFNKICELLDLNKDAVADKIGDFYTSLTTDKTFILLEDGKWDLQKNHPVNINLEDEEEEDEEELEVTDEEEEEMEDLDADVDDLDDDDLDDVDDELSIIPEDELDDEN